MIRICFRAPQFYAAIGLIATTNILVLLGNPRLPSVPFFDIHHIPELAAFACLGSLVDRMGFTRKALIFMYATTSLLGGIVVGLATYSALTGMILVLEVIAMATLLLPLVVGFFGTEWYYRKHLAKLRKLQT
jgi:hypothetical protein